MTSTSIRISIAVLAGVLAIFTVATSAMAHVPHDDVLAIELSPSYSSDGTIFAVVRGVLFRSTNGGNHWQRLSRGLGKCPHWVNEIAVSPDYYNDETLFSSCYFGGLHRSTDRGNTWEQIGDFSGSGIQQIEFSPAYDEDQTLVAIAFDGSFYRSTDRGTTWNGMPDAPTDISVVSWRHGLLVAGSDAGLVFQSTDAGAHWSELSRLPDRQATSALWIDLEDGDRAIFAGGETGGVYRLAELGKAVSLDLPDLGVTSVAAVSSEGGRRLLVTTWNNAVYTFDGGAKEWSLSSQGLQKDVQADAYKLPHFRSVVAGDNGVLFLASFCGVFRSTDLGQTWVMLETTLHHITGVAASKLENGGSVIAIGTYGGGGYLSTDDGLTWQPRLKDISNPRLGAVAFAGASPTLYAATYNFVLRLEDLASAWKTGRIEVYESVTERFRTRLRRLLSRSTLLREKVWFDRLLDSRVGLFQPLSFAVSSDYEQDRTVFAATYPSGVIRSVDGGESFQVVWGGTGSPTRSLAISNEFGRDGTIYAAVSEGIYVSNDRGNTWQSGGVERKLGDSFLGISPGFSRDSTVFAGNAFGVHVTRNRGRDWSEVASNADLGGPVSSLYVSPSFESDRLIIVQIRGGELLLCEDVATGFSCRPSPAADSGLEFIPVIERESPPLVAFSPFFGSDGVVYAASAHRILRSSDGGYSWQRLSREAVFEAEAGIDTWFHVAISLSGTWNRISQVGASHGAVIASTESGSSMSFHFVGEEITWVGARHPSGGRSRVFVDGEVVAEVDQYADEPVLMADILTLDNLASGPHEITIVVSENRSTAPGAEVSIDAFRVRNILTW